MARPATGYIRERKGKWIPELRGEYLGSFDTRELAEETLRGALRLDSDRAPQTLRTEGAKWLIARELDGDIRGIDPEGSVWRQHVESAFFADWPLRRIRPLDIKKHLTTLSKKKALIVTRTKAGVTKRKSDHGVSRQVVVHARRLLLAFFSEAVLEGKVASNPVRDVPVPKMATVTEEEDEWTFLLANEIAQLFAAIEKVQHPTRRAFYRAVYAVAIYGGLRKGEVFGLRWEDISLDRNELRVRRSWDGPTKTKSSMRPVPLLRPLREALELWRRDGGVVKSHGLVFCAPPRKGETDSGGCFGKSYDAAWETQWRRKAGARPYVRFHDLRHTCASHLRMGTFGVRLELLELKEWLGHSDIKTTERYTHLAPGSLNEKVRQLGTVSDLESQPQKRK